MKKYIFLSLLLAAMLPICTSCDDFLDKDPSKSSRKPISDISQLDALLASFSSLYSESNPSFLCTDDYGLTPDIERERTGNSSSNDLDDFTWNTRNNRTSRCLWDGEYSKIFQANLVIANIDNVTGDPADKANLKAEAHFLRAYSMFTLAVAHCLYPSSEAQGELGLPLRATTSFEESVACATLGETFAHIENDLTEALAISKPLRQSDGTLENWRGNAVAVRAFAARYYLYMGDYEKAAGYADEVLREYNVLKDFNDPAEMYYHEIDDIYVINQGKPDQEEITVKYPYTKNQFYGTNGYPELLGWQELLFARCMSYASWWYIPSDDLLATYTRDIKDGNPDNDLRYRYFVVEDFGLRYSNRTTAGRCHGYCQFFYDNLISGPTVAEMYLIKAECLARSGNAGDALAQLDILRRARISSDAYSSLPVSTPAAALKTVLDERRREMPLTIRWYDIKRYAWNDDPSDDVTVTHTIFPYSTGGVMVNDPVVTHTLEPRSRHYAIPIPDIDINRSDGVLVQNRY